MYLLPGFHCLPNSKQTSSLKVSTHSLSFFYDCSTLEPVSQMLQRPSAIFFFCFVFYRIVLISGRRSFYSVFSVLPYRDCSQAGYVYPTACRTSKPPPASAPSFPSLPLLVPLLPVDVLSSDWPNAAVNPLLLP